MSNTKSVIKGELWAWFKAGIFAYVFVSLTWQVFYVPTGSMEPTIEPGDAVIAAKYPYGYTRYSAPFNPPLGDGHYFKDTPRRGDIVVFYDAKINNTNVTKRVVALPGESVQMKRGRLYINDILVERREIEKLSYTSYRGIRRDVTVYEEILPGGVKHKIYEATDRGSADNTRRIIVPSGEYFVMGDNRDESADSRSSLGTVPEGFIFGRAEIVSLSFGDCREAKETGCFLGLPIKRFFSALE